MALTTIESDKSGAPACRLVRSAVLLALAALLLAGCNAPQDDQEQTTAEPDCPRWILNTRHTEHVNAPRYFYQNLTADDTGDRDHTHGENHLRHGEDRPLDKLDIEFTDVRVEDGELRARFEGAQSGRAVSVDRLGNDPADDSQPLRFGPGDHTGTRLSVSMSDDDGPMPTDPEPLRVVWSFEADRDGNPTTPSQADLHYSVELYYRDC